MILVILITNVVHIAARSMKSLIIRNMVYWLASVDLGGNVNKNVHKILIVKIMIDQPSMVRRFVVHLGGVSMIFFVKVENRKAMSVMIRRNVRAKWSVLRINARTLIVIKNNLKMHG